MTFHRHAGYLRISVLLMLVLFVSVGLLGTQLGRGESVEGHGSAQDFSNPLGLNPPRIGAPSDSHRAETRSLPQLSEYDTVGPQRVTAQVETPTPEAGDKADPDADKADPDADKADPDADKATQEVLDESCSQEDSDEDGLTECQEFDEIFDLLGVITEDYPDLYRFPITTKPEDPDTDGDGLTDGDEVFGKYGYRSNPRKFDTDGDGLDDKKESELGLDPNRPDTDGDGLSDYEETSDDAIFKSNPLNQDTDDDGLTDYQELHEISRLIFENLSNDEAKSIEDFYRTRDGQPIRTDPNNPDTDGDGLTDAEEVLFFSNWRSNPTVQDTDGDGLSDSEERNEVRAMLGLAIELNPSGYAGLTRTNPNKFDSDGDGLSDGEEVNGTNGTAFQSNPMSTDTDGDGLSDLEEVRPSREDTPSTNPNLVDTDGDGLSDVEELFGVFGFKTNPTLADTDGDKLSDMVEVKALYGFSTDPTKKDTDGDEVSDWDEIFLHDTNPTDASQPGAAFKGIWAWIGGTPPLWLMVGAMATLAALIYFGPGLQGRPAAAGESGYLLSNMESRLENRTRENESLQSRLDQERGRFADVSNQLSQVQTRVVAMQNQVEDSQRLVNQKEQEGQRDRSNISALSAQIEELKQELTVERERLQSFRQQNTEMIQDMEEVPALQRQVEEAEAQLRHSAQNLRGPLLAQIPDMSASDTERAWALRERIALFQQMDGRIKEMNSQFFEPAKAASKSLIDRLEKANVDTAVYRSSLEIGDLGAVVILERILQDLVDKLEAAEKGVDPALLSELDELEVEVNEKFLDIRFRVVPSGMIRFAKRLVTEAANPQENIAIEKTVKEIIKVLREYLGD